MHCKMDESPILELLQLMDKCNITYVVWKDKHDLRSALHGDGDLDVFISEKFSKKLFELASNKGWMSVENPLYNYPYISHFYKIDNDKLYHLHVYFKLVTGESKIKEYILPLDKWLIDNRIRSKINDNVWVLNDGAQAYIFALRHLLKCGSFQSRRSYSIKLNSYSEEWSYLNGINKNFANIGPIDITTYIEGSGLEADYLKLPNIKNSILTRYYFSKYLRIPIIFLPLYRFKMYSSRKLSRIIYNNKKILIPNGSVISILGFEGAGKSTMVNNVFNSFSKHFVVKSFHMGKPKTYERIRNILKNIKGKKISKIDNQKNIESITNDNYLKSLRKSIMAIILGICRLSLSKWIHRLSGKGFLIVTVRYPAENEGKMDGPRLRLANTKNGENKYFYKIERKIYKNIPQSDFSIFLSVPLKTAIERNHNRVKVGKETKEQVIQRHEDNVGYIVNSKQVEYFNNNIGEEESKKSIIKLTTDYLAKSQF